MVDKSAVVNDEVSKIKEGSKKMWGGLIKEGVMYAAGGALVGLLLDTFSKKGEDTNYNFTMYGALIGGVVGTSAAAHTSDVTEAIANRGALIPSKTEGLDE
mgnify:CR=1 FL=1